ncbi:hypothetical protein, partial [Planktotalea sp.]|uniref:GspE/PulE/PilB domain-containing protein n=1 Tax=Planktotalea sp. TaxID=2029877 RepID=UPI003299337F
MNAPKMYPGEPDHFPVPQTARRPLGRLLIERGLLSAAELFAALGDQRFSDARLGHLLRSRHLISEDQLLETLAIQYDVPLVDPVVFPPDLSLLQDIDPHSALQIGAIPWARSNGQVLIATSDPENFESIQRFLPAHLRPASMVLAKRDTIEKLLCQNRLADLTYRAEHLVPEEL